MKELTTNIVLGGLAIALVIGVFFGVITIWGNLNVYLKELGGKAQLREAEWSRQILVEEAKAQKESSILYAEAEVERAKGVAQANEIIGDGLKGNEEYLRYLYIDSIAKTDNQIIYIPTEAGLPILEATRR